MFGYSQDATLLGILHLLLVVLVIPVVLLTKKDSTSAIAWSLAVILMPFFGTLLYWEFGYNYLYRGARRKRQHLAKYSLAHPPPRGGAARGGRMEVDRNPANELADMATRADAFPASSGNQVVLYHDTQQAFDAMLAAIGAARHHVHVEFFIIRADATGQQLLDALAEKARQGVEVRLLYDGWGSFRLGRRTLEGLRQAGGHEQAFLPLSPLRSMLHFNLRNHRKILVVDGRVGFTGGMNVADEYLGKNQYFGYWRDTVVRLEGPAVAGLQRVFAEDWSFAGREALDSPAYFPDIDCPGIAVAGGSLAQIAAAGPDQDPNCIREIYLMLIEKAQQRLWIASPYFIPDASLLDALRLARYRDVDVRLLSILRPDHYLSYYAGRYFMSELLGIGVKVYQYQKGMMHSKLMLVDGRWAMVGSANLDYRSLRLNFEAGCLLHTAEDVRNLEMAFERDLDQSIFLTAEKFVARSVPIRVLENGCRLLAGML